MADSGERTEQPTQRRLERARREGQFPSSKEFISSVQFLAFLVLSVGFGGVWFFKVLSITRQLLSRAFSTELTPKVLVAMVYEFVLPMLTPLLLGGGLLLLIVMFAQMATTQFGLSPSKLVPDIQRLNFVSKIKNLPGQNLPPFLQALVLLPLIGMRVNNKEPKTRTQFRPRPGITRRLARCWSTAPS